MTTGKAGKLWRSFISRYEFPLAWGAVAALMLIYIPWQAFSWLTLSFPFWKLCVAFLFTFYCKAAFQWVMDDLGEPVSPAVQERVKKIFMAAEYMLVIISAIFAAMFLTYLFCTLNAPLTDRQLDAADRFFGFDWLSWFATVKNHPVLWSAMSVAYASLLPQLVFGSVYFSLRQDRQRMRETFRLLLGTLLIAIVLSGLCPALGPVCLHHMEDAYRTIQPGLFKSFADIRAIRAHAQLPSPRLTGLITFPSYHAACAVILCHAFRRTGGVGYVVGALNILMLVSTPVFGGHYLTDVIAGVVIALAAIALKAGFRRR